ncbi:hypothetical protein ROA7450_00548 [Roseovarius albus]|uniref:Uncharacterized protein n=2 Tax=Roseovarius albus TaxID=1247867 RepID=A0A1X6YDG2_9RHOB|nr:hypothetical protein ROA7450_00548 [Roseovarius albus]
MEEGLKTELRKLEDFGAVEFTVLKDLFQGWVSVTRVFGTNVGLN